MSCKCKIVEPKQSYGFIERHNNYADFFLLICQHCWFCGLMTSRQSIKVLLRYFLNLEIQILHNTLFAVIYEREVKLLMSRQVKCL